MTSELWDFVESAIYPPLAGRADRISSPIQLLS